MKKRSFFIAAVLLLVLILPAAAVLGLDVVSRRGHPTLDASIERLALEEGCFSMTASLNESSGDTFRRAVWQIEEDTLYVTLFQLRPHFIFCLVSIRANAVFLDISQSSVANENVPSPSN